MNSLIKKFKIFYEETGLVPVLGINFDFINDVYTFKHHNDFVYVFTYDMLPPKKKQALHMGLIKNFKNKKTVDCWKIENTIEYYSDTIWYADLENLNVENLEIDFYIEFYEI